MPENKLPNLRRETFVEKFVRRVLTSAGARADQVFGRGSKKDALPSTNDLGDRLRRLIDGHAQINKDGRKLAPHLIFLKYAWGQTSDEFLAALKQLKNELLVAAIDHVNDNRYATLAPIKVEAKPDILIEGFALSVGFEPSDAVNSEQVQIPVEVFAQLLRPEENQAPALPAETIVNAQINLPNGTQKISKLHFAREAKKTLSVGRIKENDLFLDDDSVSKHHASLVMDAAGILRVADIGSTNGTFLNGERIAYGKSYEIRQTDKIGFGDSVVSFGWELPETVSEDAPATSENTVDSTALTPDAQTEAFPQTILSQSLKSGVTTSNLETANEAAMTAPDFQNDPEITVLEIKKKPGQTGQPIQGSPQNLANVEPQDFTNSLPQTASPTKNLADKINKSK